MQVRFENVKYMLLCVYISTYENVLYICIGACLYSLMIDEAVTLILFMPKFVFAYMFISYRLRLLHSHCSLKKRMVYGRKL